MAKYDAELAAFAKEVDDFSSHLEQEVLPDFQAGLALRVLTGVVLRTPVDRGRARQGWQLTVGAPATGEAGRGDPIQKGQAELARLGPFGVVFITNNVEYILVLEEGGFDPPDPGPSKDPRPGRTGRILVSGGYSTQAPFGMVGVTLAELSQQFAVANDARRRGVAT